MSVRSGQSITVLFTTRVFSTGVGTDADSTPTGTLYVNGTADAASVTVTNITTGVYKAAVTLPTLAVGDVVDLRIAATVSTVADNAIIWRDTKDVVIDSAGLVDATTVKVGPSGSATAQTAGDIPARLPAALVSGRIDASIGANAAGNLTADVQTIKTQTVTCAAGVTVNVNVGTTQPLNFTGTAGSALVKSDMVDIAGAAVSTTTAQIGANAVQINAVSTSSVTTINANQGTTQPVNFTGTAGSALVKSDTVDIAGAAVSASTAQLGVNVVNWAGTAVLTPTVAGSPLVNVTRSGTAQAGSANAITLDAGASATNSFYNGNFVLLTGGTGAGQCRTIVGYIGSTKSATIQPSWSVNPDNTSTFAILPSYAPSITSAGAVIVGNSLANIRSATAQAGSTINTIKLDAGASATNNLYTGNLVQIVTGTGLGQSRTIIAYNGTTKVATVDRNWVTTPTNTSSFSIVANIVPSSFSDEGVAQAAGATTVTLASTASATDSLYVGSVVTILSGTGSGQTREITAYNGTTKVATVDSAWSVNPDSTSGYAVIPTTSGTGAVASEVDVSAIAMAVLTTILTEDYAVPGAAFTLSQALYEICQVLEERAVVDTTLTVLKRDGSTEAMTFTLDSASVPRTQTRSS